MLACGSLSNCKLPLISSILAICNQKSLSFRNLLIKKPFPVGDKEAVAIGPLSEDSSADESMFSVRLDVFLNDDDLVPELLHAQIMEVARID